MQSDLTALILATEMPEQVLLNLLISASFTRAKIDVAEKLAGAIRDAVAGSAVRLTGGFSRHGSGSIKAGRIRAQITLDVAT
jgi:hypothetical protein